MKRLFFYIFILLTLFSCGKDSVDDVKDDIINNNENNGNTGDFTFRGIIDANTGLRLTTITGWWYKYDAIGRLEGIYRIDSNFSWKFDYNANLITESVYNIYYRISGDGYYAVSYNNNGYINSMKTTTGSAYTASYTFSYDSNGHMNKCISDIKIPVGDYSKELSFSLSSIWDNNQIISMTCESIEKIISNGSVLDYHSLKNNMKFLYDSNTSKKNINRFKQYAHSIMYNFDITAGLQFIGVLGKGPNVLPSGREELKTQDDNGNVAEFHDTYQYEYSFNADGSIATVKNNIGGKQVYAYDKVK